MNYITYGKEVQDTAKTLRGLIISELLGLSGIHSGYVQELADSEGCSEVFIVLKLEFWKGTEYGI